jgi:platelet-activating factor acetylhydrolase IB subunit beta/gamma
MSNPAAIPDIVEDSQGDGRWMSMHNRFMAEAREKEPEVVLIGDTHIQRLAHNEIWDKMFVPLHCLNFGIGSDQTQNVLWRVQNGELDNFSPKVIVVGVGTHNYQHSVEQVVEGILAIVDTCHEKQPQAEVLVMGIPPRGQFPNPVREKISAINQLLAGRLHGMPSTTFFHVDPSLFVSASDGTISHHDLYDYLHLSRTGIHKLAEPLLEEIEMLLKNFLTADSASVGEPEN